jgi:hypothetical protein
VTIPYLTPCRAPACGCNGGPCAAMEAESARARWEAEFCPSCHEVPCGDPEACAELVELERYALCDTCGDIDCVCIEEQEPTTQQEQA